MSNGLFSAILVNYKNNTKPFTTYIVKHALLSGVILFLGVYILPMLGDSILLGWLFILSLVFVFILKQINKLTFQRQYPGTDSSLKIFTTNGEAIAQTLKILFLQLLISGVISFFAIMIFSIPGVLFKDKFPFLLPIITFSVICFNYIWIMRLCFVFYLSNIQSMPKKMNQFIKINRTVITQEKRTIILIVVSQIALGIFTAALKYITTDTVSLLLTGSSVMAYECFLAILLIHIVNNFDTQQSINALPIIDTNRDGIEG